MSPRHKLLNPICSSYFIIGIWLWFKQVKTNNWVELLLLLLLLLLFGPCAVELALK
jgi:hypothetical protein